MVVDSSAIFAIAFGEPERQTFLERILLAPIRAIGAPTLLECRIVAIRRAGADWNAILQSVLDDLGMEIVPFDERLLVVATDAFRRFGRGLNRAGLNFGDCMSYAIAKARNEPLLYKGADFSRTDVTPAV